MHLIRFRLWGSAPDPAGRAYSAPQTHSLNLRGLLLRGGGRRGEGPTYNGRELKGGRGGEESEREGKEKDGGGEGKWRGLLIMLER